MRRLILPLLCLAVAGCAPPYLAELDLSAALTRQMTAAGTIGPLNVSSTATSVRFLPVKPTATGIGSLNVQSGFAIIQETGSVNLSFAYVDSSGKAQFSSVQTVGPAGSDPNYPRYDFDVTTTTTTTGNIVVFSMDPTTPSLNTATLFTATLPSGPFGFPAGVPSNPQTLTTMYTNAPDVIGESVAPAPSPTSDTFNWLLWSGSGAVYTESSFSLSAGTAVFATTGLPLTFNPLITLPLGTRFLYYTNQSRTLSYASSFSGGQWICYQWTPTTAPVVLPGVKNRVDAILTSGDLLSTEGGTLRVYDPNGSPVMSTSLRGLQFCYEAYLGSTPYLFFSLAINLRQGDRAFRVYAIPTSSIRSVSG